MRTVNVRLPGGRGYPIYIGSGLLATRACFEPHITGAKVMVVTNETVAPLYVQRILDSLSNADCHLKIVPDGEQYKTLDTASTIFDALLDVPCDRDTTIIALGGGVIGDVVGFAAACYQRGVAYIQVPTTLLAQVDSSVGGKTAVNHPRGKNMIGAFHQPRCVVTDTDTLSTLDTRQFRSGLAEIIKYGLISDTEFFAWLEANIERLLDHDPEALIHAIECSCRNKAAIVEQDERDSSIRAILNFGHTFGHAIEAGQGYGVWLHGEAVSAGMVIAAEISKSLGWLSDDDACRLITLLGRANLPIQPPADMSADRFLKLMAIDKKVSRGSIRLILLEGIGKARIVADLPRHHVEDAIAKLALRQTISA